MAVTPTAQACTKAIQAYQVCRPLSAKGLPQSRSITEQQLRNKSDTVQFSEEALDRLESFKQEQAEAVSKAAQTVTEKENELNKSLTILNLGRDASVQEIRKAYLNAIQNYHPDKHANLPPEFRQLAETKSKQINELYSALLKFKSGDAQ